MDFQVQQQDDDQDDVHPIGSLLSEEEEKEGEKGLYTLEQEAVEQQLQQHYIRSIESTLVIRQLPSQGLSFQLWPAATTLLKLLDNHRCHPSTSPLSPALDSLSDGRDCGSLRILELGSGTGLVGIAAALTLRAEVTVTDLPHVIPNLEFNVDANASTLARQGGTVHVAALKWGEEDDVDNVGRDFDLVLASDLVYHDHLYEPLLKTLRLLMGSEEEKEKKMVFVMAHLRRWKKDSVFFKRAKKFFDVGVVHVDAPCQGSRTGVVVYRFDWKKV